MGNAAAAMLERVADAHGRLLRVAREPGPGLASKRLVLVFDVGVVALRAAAGALRAEALAPTEAQRAGHAADEEEPWWALLGHPITRVQAREGGGVLAQFRADAESPRVLLLEPSASGVTVRPVV